MIPVHTLPRLAAWRALAGLAAAGAGTTAVPSRAGAQLDYTRTMFYHGFASSDRIWKTWYGNLGGQTPIAYLRGRGLALGDTNTPRFPGTTRYADQLKIASDSIYYPNGRNVLIGHSQGGLVARGVYLGLPGVPAGQLADIRAGVSAIITVTSPHQGAIIADSAVKARAFFLDVQRRVNDGLHASKFPAAILGGIIGGIVSGGVGAVVGAVSSSITAAQGAAGFALVGGLFSAAVAGLFVAEQTAGQQLDVGDLAAFPNIPALQDLRPSADAIQGLNASTADAAVPRANIVGRIPYKYAVVRLSAGLQGQNEEEQIAKLRQAKGLLHVCKYTGYATLILSRQARRCGFAIRVLDRVDDTWARYTAGTVNGSGRDVPSDGVVPNEQSNYPGLTGVGNFPPVQGASHTSIYTRADGMNTVEQAMRLIGMQGPQPSPPRRGDPPSALLASIDGPTSLTVGESGYWTATLSGGVPPYAYAWSVGGNGPDVGWTFYDQGSQTIGLSVTDAAGTTVNTGLGVFVGSGCGSQVVCSMAPIGGGVLERSAPTRAHRGDVSRPTGRRLRALQR